MCVCSCGHMCVCVYGCMLVVTSPQPSGFSPRRKRSRARKAERREQEASERGRALQSQEEERMRAFKAQLGLQPGQRITIQPRQ